MEKLTCKFQPVDWHNQLNIHSKITTSLNDATTDLRQEARELKLLSDSESKWTKINNSHYLADRTDKIIRWKEKLDSSHEYLNDELHELHKTKEFIEVVIANLNKKSFKVANCLSRRDERREIEYLHDAPQIGLQSYRDSIDNTREKLRKICDQLFFQILQINQIRAVVLEDLQDKSIAMQTDFEQYNLRANSPTVSFKANAMRIVKDSITHEEWLAFTQANLARANQEILKSRNLRESTFKIICLEESILDKQKNQTHITFQNRMHELNSALVELNGLRIDLENEIELLTNDSQTLEKSMLDKLISMKLVQTRLERRTERPGMDSVNDNVQNGLFRECNQIEAVLRNENKKISQLQHALHQLNNQLWRVNDAIRLKTESLNIDSFCVQRLNEISE